MEFFVNRRIKKKSLYENGRIFIWGPHGSGKTTWVKEYFDYIELDYDNMGDFLERVDPYTWILIENEDFDFIDRDRTIYISIKDRNVSDDVTKIEFKPRERLQHGTQDDFINTDEYIYDNLSTQKSSYIDMIDKCYGEHGNCIGIIHENIAHSNLDISQIADILSELSMASYIDDIMYKGNWDLFKIFNIFGYVTPCKIIQGAVKTRFPASIWTKFLNECMKRKKINDMRICIDVLWLLKEYAVTGQNPENLSSTNLDALKYVDFYGKLKPKIIQKLKKISVTK